MPETITPAHGAPAMPPDLWDDLYLSIDDGRWLACAMGTIAFYEATWQALCVAMAQGDTPQAAAHCGRLQGLIRPLEDLDHA